MGSFLKLFNFGYRSNNKDHFASVVKVALKDGDLNEAEQSFLKRLANRLDISEEDYKDVLKNYDSYPIKPPISYNERLERLYDLAHIVRADDDENLKEIQLLEKISVGLGFNVENVKYIADKALTLVYYEVGLDEFIKKMKHMNH